MPTQPSDGVNAEPAAPGIATKRFLSWAVHLFTASGAVWGLFAVLAIMGGDLGLATVLLLLCLFTDSVDGSIARRVGVERWTPTINGRRMDDIVDYLTFVFVPCFFMVVAGSLTSPWWAAVPVLASAFGFSQEDAKTEDHFFLGWPSYWNVLAFYLWLLHVPPWVGTLLVVGFSIAIFVPYKYIYPSRLENPLLRHLFTWAGMVWGIAIGWAALDPEAARAYHLVGWSLTYPALYLFFSFRLGGLHRRNRIAEAG